MQTWRASTGTRTARRCAAFRDGPAALVDQPVDEGADGVGQRLLDRVRRRLLALAVRLGHRQRDDRRLPGDVVARTRSSGTYSRLQRRPRSPVITRRERGVDRALDARTPRKLAAARTRVRRRASSSVRRRRVDADVGAAEPVDRLLRIADDEQLARPDDAAASRSASRRSSAASSSRISACSGSVSWNSSTNRCVKRCWKLRRAPRRRRARDRARAPADPGNRARRRAAWRSS